MSQVQVKFFTSQQEYSVPSAAILVPTAFKRRALSEIINHLLGKSESDQVTFDFLIDGVLLRTSLDSYLSQHGLSAENTVSIEYMVSLPPPKPVAAFQADDWISAVSVVSTDRFVTAGYDGVVRMWDRAGETLVKHQLGTAPLKALTHVKGNASEASPVVRVAVAGMNQKVSIMDLQGASRQRYSSHLYTASWDGSIKVYSISESAIESAVASPPTKKAKKNDTSSAPMAAPAPQLQALGSLTGHVGAVNSVAAGSATVAYSPRAGLIASGHADPVIRLWDSRSSEATLVKARLVGHRNQVASVAWAPESAYHLASASLDGSVRVFDIRSPSQSLHTVQAPEDLEAKTAPKMPVAKRLCVTWGHGLVASGGEDCQLNVWEAPEFA
ncbi:WD40-repeat-containing domain protein [Catenaria anguillulae PL171]|uniref:WD40-repeat-containing domain protein n=1 Tax=Catenaria anguillulae PL171 TaxID=765915 RepID=A0A1Y2HW23_9FUNG|nr:WD40-repeat-containing domain protein [Catenaria anguillulae PL171]